MYDRNVICIILQQKALGFEIATLFEMSLWHHLVYEENVFNRYHKWHRYGAKFLQADFSQS